MRTSNLSWRPSGTPANRPALLQAARAFMTAALLVNVSLPGARADNRPAAVDLRPRFDQWGLQRSLQRDRPTCSVFTVAGALEFAVATKQGHTPRLSVEFLNWAANKTCGDREDGGFFSDLWRGYAAYGICTTGDYPYQTKFDPAGTPPPEAFADAKTRLGLGLRLNWIKEWNVNTGLTDAHLEAIERTLAAGWPVCGGFRWPKQERWVNDVLQMCPANAVRDGHSVLLVGYRNDSSQPGGGVFIFRNTAHGGADGFMPFAYAQDYMNDAVWVDYESRPKQTGTAATPGLPYRDPLGGFLNLSAGRSRRISSNEQPKWNDANLDMNILPPGKSIEMPVLEGPGVITHIWLTSHAGRVNELNALSLRIYWDGRKEPGVEAPLGEFFAVGQGKPATVESVPVQVSPSGALSCYWRMPFAKSARIVVANDNPDRTTGLYWQVDWEELEDLPEGTPYFHARYRQEYPAVAGSDYVVADLEGAGSYVGTVMSVTLGQDGWWGEGDDFFYIDGETVPSLQGTGSEDYFNDAWGFRPRTGHWFGQPRWQGDVAGNSGIAYRWHILDPVGFTKSLKVALEHKGNRAEDTEGFYLERPDFINSVAFWYQTGTPKSFGVLPPYPERGVPWQHHHLVPALKQARATGKIKPRVDFAGMFGARPVVLWTNTVRDARLTIPFSVAEAGRYAVRLTAVAAPDYGLYDIELDGKTALARTDFRAPDFDESDLGLGTHDLGSGEHALSFRALAVEGKKARPLAVEMLNLLRLPSEATRAVKTHNEAHFIRLGIGRAVYAYRLANGALPASLDTLVQAGLLPARYLADENHRPLRCRREGDFLVVESDGPEPWAYRWQGLDARR
ncbi:MAG TPA: DUF2961 domain-containing protein [Verrucomicrobiae bacterium]